MPISLPHQSCKSNWLIIAAMLLTLLMATHIFAQTELAAILGRVTDPSGAVVVAAEVEVRNIDTNLVVLSATNADGLYTVPSLHPGHYVISVRKSGFKTVSVTQLDINVQDNVVRNFVLQVGSSAESVTVTAEGENINTTDATVSTVVDRNFPRTLPMNGRSFQTLIQLTPGVVLTANNGNDQGQLALTANAAASNYWMVDGVSANIGIAATGQPSNGLSGSLGSFSATGGTNSLRSRWMPCRNFRIQTSTFAPEFGRTPGGQISIATRSGTNRYHGAIFDYFCEMTFLTQMIRSLTAKGFPNRRNARMISAARFPGPIVKDSTFFFFSYEGLRLRLAANSLTTVPDLTSRQNAVAAVQPYLNAFPLPNGPAAGNGMAE